MRAVINAPPGYGKSRLIARLAATRRPAVVFVRSHLEGLQMARYIKEFGRDAGLLFGRKALCPFNARDSVECLKLREHVCKAVSKRPKALVFDIRELYGEGVCPYEALHVAGRERDVVVLPLAYISKVSNISAIADLFEAIELAAVDEVHNALSVVKVNDWDFYSRRYCVEDGGALYCLALPLVGELLKSVRNLVAASASVLRPFSKIFTYFLNASYVHIGHMPGAENLHVEYIPLEIRYKTRIRREYVERVVREIQRVYEEYRRVAVFLPNRRLASLYLKKLAGLPVSTQPLGDLDHVVVTYYGSPISEGVNLSVRAGVLVGFPFPNVKSRELWLGVKILRRMGFSGYKYGVLFAAVNNVVQAVGRVARDLAVEKKYVLLIDDRFWQFRHLLPSYISIEAV
ncbi:MAG: helicase C-terminal domain-containing protein [Pyrobaculum sp.]